MATFSENIDSELSGILEALRGLFMPRNNTNSLGLTPKEMERMRGLSRGDIAPPPVIAPRPQNPLEALTSPGVARRSMQDESLLPQAPALPRPLPQESPAFSMPNIARTPGINPSAPGPAVVPPQAQRNLPQVPQGPENVPGYGAMPDPWMSALQGFLSMTGDQRGLFPALAGGAQVGLKDYETRKDKAQAQRERLYEQRRTQYSDERAQKQLEIEERKIAREEELLPSQKKYYERSGRYGDPLAKQEAYVNAQRDLREARKSGDKEKIADAEARVKAFAPTAEIQEDRQTAQIARDARKEISNIRKALIENPLTGTSLPMRQQAWDAMKPHYAELVRLGAMTAEEAFKELGPRPK